MKRVKKFLKNIADFICICLCIIPREYIDEGYFLLGQGREDFDK